MISIIVFVWICIITCFLLSFLVYRITPKEWKPDVCVIVTIVGFTLGILFGLVK